MHRLCPKLIPHVTRNLREGLGSPVSESIWASDSNPSMRQLSEFGIEGGHHLHKGTSCLTALAGSASTTFSGIGQSLVCCTAAQGSGSQQRDHTKNGQQANPVGGLLESALLPMAILRKADGRRGIRS